MKQSIIHIALVVKEPLINAECFYTGLNHHDLFRSSLQ